MAPVPGGTGRYSVELAAALAQSADPSDRVRGVTAWHRDLTAARAAGVPLTRLPLPARGLVLAWEHRSGPRLSRADLVHAPTPLLPPPSRAPLVVTIHDTVPWTHPETLTPRGVRWHIEMAERAVEQAAAIAVPSQVVARELLGVLPGLEPARVHVLGAGVSAAFRAEPDPAAVAAAVTAFGLDERPYVLSLATLEPRKGLDVALAALALTAAGGPVLAIVGQPGWGGLDLVGAAARLGLPAERVKLLGRVSDPELHLLLRGARALLMPSRAEGFGLPVAEAMAAGTPVISSDAPALVEVAGQAALVVAREDAGALAAAIERVLTEPGLAESLSAAGRAQAASYTWPKVAERAWALYRSLVRGAN
nr:glycosyltransferase family 1 protein [Jatrophihabitans telluris]